MRAALRLGIAEDGWRFIEGQPLPSQDCLYIFCGFSKKRRKGITAISFTTEGTEFQRVIFPLSSFSLFLLCSMGIETRQLINLPHSDGAIASWKPSRSHTPSSRHRPATASVTRIYFTKRSKPPGSTDAAWSLPHMARSSVRCLSTMHAPKATAMADGTSPTS